MLRAESRARAKSDEKPSTNIVLSTSEASRLIPWVAVAQRSLVTSQSDTLIAFVKAWTAGQHSLESDAAGGARTIGNLDGAPEPLTLLERLGELEPVRPAENTELFALSGRGAVTLRALFDLHFRLWKDTRVLTAPAPERSPINDLIVAGIARAEPKLLKTPAPSETKPKAPATAKALLVRRVAGAKLDDDAVIEAIGTLAGIFHRSALSVSVHGAPKKKADEIIELTVDRYAIAPGRIIAGKAAAKPNVMTTIEILEPR